MSVQAPSLDITYADKGAVVLGLVEVADDLAPYLATGGVVGRTGLAADAHCSAHHSGNRRAIPPENDGCERVGRDASARGVHHMGKIPAGDVFFDQFLAELALHERVGGDHADEASTAVLAPGREVKEALEEWHRQRVLPVAGAEAFPVRLVQRRIFRRDVRRIPDHCVISPAQQPPQLLLVLNLIDVLQGILADQSLLVAPGSWPWPVQQGIARSHADAKGGRVPQARDVGGPQGRQQQPEARDGCGEKVQIYTAHRVQRPLHQFAGVGAGLAVLPALEDPGKGVEEEVTGTAGRIDEPHHLVPKLGQRWIQGAIEDELLDEIGRLQQGVLRARGLGEILVQVTEKARAPGWVGKVVGKLPAIRVELAPELDKQARAIGRQLQLPERILLLVEQCGRAWQLPNLAKNPVQIAQLGITRVLLEVDSVTVLGLGVARAHAR